MPTRRSSLIILGFMGVAASARAQQWTVDPKPILDIKGTSDAGTIVFGSAQWATRLRNGTVVVADASGPAVHFIDTGGKLIKSAGRAGQGPGDFRTVTWVAKCGGDIYVWDFAQTRVTTFDESETMKRSFAFGARGGAQTTSSCNERGTLVQIGGMRRLPPAAPRDPAADYFIAQFAGKPQLIGSAGDSIATLAEVIVGEIVGGNMNGRGGGGMTRPLGQQATFALGPDRLYLGIPDSALIAVVGLDGKRIATIPVQTPTAAPTRSQYERAADIGLAIVPAQSRAVAREWVLRIPIPERLPPFTGLFLDPGGTVWAVLSVPGDGDTRLRGFAPDGAVVGSLTVPLNMNVFEVGQDYVLGGYEDADGEPHVAVYRFTRGGRR